MPNSESDNANSNSGNDPRLKSFLRQARAVIAAERGLNPRSQLKLQSLAESINLPEELFQSAIEELKSVQKPMEVALWERSFVQFLDKEFKKLPDHIVSIRMESRAVDLATRRYQLSEVRARQLIAQRAEALGMGLIAPAEAKQFIHQLIVDRIGDTTSITDETREQLYQSGDNWGLDQSRVDELVLDQLIRNRGIGRSRAGAWLAVFLFIVGGLAFAGYKYSWLEKVKQLVANQPDIILGETGDEEVSNSVRVKWWTKNFQNYVELVKEKKPSLRSALSKLAELQVDDRVLGFKNLVDTIIHSDEFERRQWKELFYNLYFREPDFVASQAALAHLAKWLIPNMGDPVNYSRFHGAYEANQMFMQLKLYEPEIRDENFRARRMDTAEKYRSALSLSVESNDDELLKRETESAIALAQWNYVLQNCWSAPALCAIVVQPLYDLSKDKIGRTELNQFRMRAIESILEVDLSRWKDLDEAIAQAIEVADEIRVNEWIRFFQSVKNREFSDRLGELLVNKTGVKPTSNRRAEVEELLSAVRLRYQTRFFKPILDRVEDARQFSDMAQQATKIPRSEMNPEVIAKVAYAVNVSMAMANGIKRNRQFDVVDELLARGVPELDEIVPLGKEKEGGQGTSTTTPSASENRQKAELISKLSKFDSMSTNSRKTAIEQLSRIAGRFQQISYDEAVVIADYLLSTMPLDEWLNVEKNLSTLKKWPNLSLAIADRLPKSATEIDQALTIFRLMFDDEITLRDTSNWKQAIAKRIYSSCLQTLQSSATNDVSNRQLAWNRLNIFLSRVYRRRHQLVREYLGTQNLRIQSNVYSDGDNWQLGCLELLMNDPETNRVESDKINRIISLINGSGFDEIEQITLANQALFEFVADRMIRDFPDRRLDVNQLRIELHTSAATAELTGQRLLLSELALLRLWDLQCGEHQNVLFTRN